jgi:hypothetical protein
MHEDVERRRGRTGKEDGRREAVETNTLFSPGAIPPKFRLGRTPIKVNGRRGFRLD